MTAIKLWQEKGRRNGRPYASKRRFRDLRFEFPSWPGLLYTANMSASLTLKAPAKINLTLRVGDKRADGFHSVRSVIQAISLADTITLSHIESDSDELYLSGPESSTLKSAGAGGDNLVLRALSALRKSRPEMPSCRIELEKLIPLGAGLGGGSSDCAVALRGANELFGLQFATEELIEIGADLGSDVPFFFSSGSTLVSGRGELLEPLSPPLNYTLILINPGIHISTAEAFIELDQFRSLTGWPDAQNAVNTALTSPEVRYSFSGSGEAMSWWRSLEEEGSDFESLYLSGRCKAKAISSFADVLRQIQDRFEQSGASFIRMSGSGSTVFGVFSADVAPDIEAKRFDSIARRGWRIFICRPISLPDNSI